MLFKKNTHSRRVQPNLNQPLLLSVLALSLSTIASSEVCAQVQSLNVETLAFPNLSSNDDVEILPDEHLVNSLRVRKDSATSLRTNNVALSAGLSVGCTQAELTAAIEDGNTAGTAVLQLPPNCTYIIQTPATSNEALPIITGNITIIGGENSVISRDPSAAAFRIFTVAANASLTLRYLTIKNGDTTGLGGGILDNGTLVLDNVTFLNNNAANGGGLAVISGATAQVLTNTFLSNTTTSVGGGGVINFGELTIKNSYFSGNTGPFNGGGINTQPSGTTTIMLTLMTSNTSGSLGGAMSNLGTTNILQSIINNNTGSNGGAIATGNSNVTISNTSNTALLNNHPDNCSPLNTISGCVD